MNVVDSSGWREYFASGKIAHRATLWTQDGDFEGHPGVRYFRG